jgi:NADPH-dependent 2,4-dienoyl-CoA reductase/sulfur reductase-like enzyme
VTVCTSVAVAGVRGDRRIDALTLQDGRTVEADLVLVAVGAAPDTGWLAGAGVPADGVPVQRGGATALPGVFAAGDCACPLDSVSGRRIRREHWESAARSGAAAARAMLGRPLRPEPPAGFWSDQHGVRIQLVGDPAGAERTTLDRGKHDADFTLTYWRGADLAAILLVGRPEELPRARRLVAAGVDLEEAA